MGGVLGGLAPLDASAGIVCRGAPELAARVSAIKLRSTRQCLPGVSHCYVRHGGGLLEPTRFEEITLLPGPACVI
jgi:hypothetical protein